MKKTNPGMKITNITEDEIKADARLNEITSLANRLLELCKVEPQASIIFSMYIPTPEDDFVAMLNLYSGDTSTQVNQLGHLATACPQFSNDLACYLNYRIRLQKGKFGTIGNALADELLAEIDTKNDRKN